MSDVCKIVGIHNIKESYSGDRTGELSFFEGLKDIPFVIKRIYYITGVKKGITRGYHAHKSLKQFIFCPYGKIELHLENINGKTDILLDNASTGVLIDCVTWREMTWLKADSVLFVAASDYYDEKDYIRDYNVFKQYMEENK